ncbi:MAG TPA: hypothetical protein VEA60_01100 [Allosphingosinicella sp.]|nr:hypothetical protein [Allosphingosinicella sp.]
MIRKSRRTAVVTAVAFAASMSLSAAPAPAQMADMCALVANEMCVANPYEFHDYDTCFNHYYRQYCPDSSEPNCLTDPQTGRTICV